MVRKRDQMVGMLLALLGCGMFGAFSASAWAKCKLPGEALKASVLDEYEKQPLLLLESYPRGGYALRQATAQFVARGPRAAAQLFAIAARANSNQQMELGMALRQVVDVCVSQDADTVRVINSLISSSRSGPMSQAFWKDDLVLTDSAADAAPVKRAPAKPDDLSPDSRVNAAAKALPDPFGQPDEWR